MYCHGTVDFFRCFYYTQIKQVKGGGIMEIIHESHGVVICCHTLTFDAPGQQFHWHENYEICRVKDKPCRFLIDGKMIEAGVGDIVCFREHSVHRFLIDSDDTNILIVQFPLSVLLSASVSLSPLKDHIPQSEIDSIPGLGENLNALFDIMENEDDLYTGQENVFLSTVTASLYFLLMRHFADGNKNSSTKKDRFDFFCVVDYLNAHYTEEINMQSVANALHMSRGQIGLLFSKYAGIGMGDYLNSLRVKRVNELISRGHSITEAAYDSGFRTIRTFNNVYKKMTGETPSDRIRGK